MRGARLIPIGIALLTACAHGGAPLTCGSILTPPTAAASRDTVHYCRQPTRFRLEAGLLNSGALATEVTHRVRAQSQPGSIEIGWELERSHLVTAVSVALSMLTVTKCEISPCAPVGRDYRPGRTEPIVIERNAVFLIPRVGWRFGAALEVGLAAPILQTAYSLAGPSPMLVAGAYAGSTLRWKTIGVYARATAIPPQPARWVAFSEWSGLKQNGKPYPNGSHDPLWIVPLELGVRTYIREE